MRTLAIFLTGAVLGCVAAAFGGPHLIHWYAQPPFAMGCDCGQAMSWAMGKLVISEGIGAAAGAVGLLALFLALRRKKPPAPPPPAPAR